MTYLGKLELVDKDTLAKNEFYQWDDEIVGIILDIYSDNDLFIIKRTHESGIGIGVNMIFPDKILDITNYSSW